MPRSTAPHPGRNDPQNAQAQAHARALRGHLETLEDIRKSRAQLVERVQRLVEADDIRPRIMREESNIARWVEVTPSMFEMTITEEMEKYDRFKDDVEEGALKQEEVLDHIKVWRSSASRCTDKQTEEGDFRRETNNSCNRGKKISLSKIASMHCSRWILRTISIEKSYATWRKG